MPTSAALHPLEQKLAAEWPAAATRGHRVIVAVSGGADSVALCRGLVRLSAAAADDEPNAARGLIVAHFNHRLRGEAAERDQRFVEQLAARLNLPCETGLADASLPLEPTGDGLEAELRAFRYDFLQATAERLGARYVATAHTANDQAETILHRVVRGTGLAGLTGMPCVRPLGEAVSLVRPLLTVERAEVLDYLARLGQEYCHDATNLDLSFMRNRIRHELLPLLAKHYNPGVGEALLRLGRLAGEAQSVVDQLAARLVERAVGRPTADRLTIDCRILAGEPRYLARETLIAAWKMQRWPLQAMTLLHWEALADLLASAEQPAPRTFPGNIRAARSGDQLSLVRQPNHTVNTE